MTEPVDVSSIVESRFVKRVPGYDPANPRVITANAFHDALVAAGVIRAGEHYLRIVIDVQAGKAVIIHAERFGDERLLDVVRTLDGAEVRYGQPAHEGESGA